MTAEATTEIRVEPKIFGYTDRFAARPGESISFHVSCEEPTAYQASLVAYGTASQGKPGRASWKRRLHPNSMVKNRAGNTPASPDPTSRSQTRPR